MGRPGRIGTPKAPGAGGGGVTDHGDLTGLADDDHPQYETSAEAAAKVTTHSAASDPHGDRAAATSALGTHEADTTSIHGITDTSALETTTGSAAKVTTHAGLADPHTVYLLESAAAAVATSGSASDLATGTLPIGRIADAEITLAKLANLAEALVIGRAAAAGTGVPVGLTAAQLRTLLGLPALGAAAQADVSTLETTTSTSFADLATVGPTVNATIGPSGMCLVTVNATIFNSGAGNSTYMAYSLDADTAVTTRGALVGTVSGTGAVRSSRTTLETGLSAASHEFKAKYSVAAGTGSYSARRIIVVPL